LDERDLTGQFLPCFPLPLPFTIKGKTADQKHVMRLKVIGKDSSTNKYYLQFIEAGIHTQAELGNIIFTSFVEAFNIICKVLDPMNFASLSEQEVMDKHIVEFQFEFGANGAAPKSISQEMIEQKNLGVMFILKKVYSQLVQLREKKKTFELPPPVVSNPNQSDLIECIEQTKNNWPFVWQMILGNRVHT
jgi:hypothetical protein